MAHQDMVGDLSDKNALVTGGGRGIGRAISLALARHGASVAIGDIDLEAAHSVADEVGSSGSRAMAVELDVTSQSSVEKGVAQILSVWSQLDILVNNAGVNGAPGSDGVSEARELDWDVAFDVNVKGVMRCTRAVMDHFTARGSGKIVNIASIAARYPRPTTDYYAVSKSGVVAYTQATARRLGPNGINVNAVCPGSVWTDFHRSWMMMRQDRGLESLEGRDPHEVFSEGSRSINPMNREISAEDVAGVVVFLSSDLAAAVTGQSIAADGGQVML